MVDQVTEFIAKGAPRALSQAIEEHARGRGAVSALVVPWESGSATLNMAVTLVNADGWAIEHTNLGTVQLTDLGDDRTRVVVLSHAPGGAHADAQRAASLIEALGRQLQARFQAGGGPDAP
jgi:hypothetical protein